MAILDSNLNPNPDLYPNPDLDQNPNLYSNPDMALKIQEPNCVFIFKPTTLVSRSKSWITNDSKVGESNLMVEESMGPG